MSAAYIVTILKKVSEEYVMKQFKSLIVIRLSNLAKEIFLLAEAKYKFSGVLTHSNKFVSL